MKHTAPSLFLLPAFAAAGAWVHLDVFSWNPSGRPGRAEGGESQSIRALFALLEERYAAA